MPPDNDNGVFFMSRTFVISIEGDDNAREFLRAIQEHKVAGIKVFNKRVNDVARVRMMPVLFIYPVHDDEERRPKSARKQK
jgi:hypothetical protein